MRAQVVNIIIGIWLMVAPAVLNYNDIPADMDYIFGPVIATFAAIAFAECTRSVRLWNIPIGSWLIIQPWILGYEETIAIVNCEITGVLVIIFSLIEGKYNPDKFGGGWISLKK